MAFIDSKLEVKERGHTKAQQEVSAPDPSPEDAEALIRANLIDRTDEDEQDPTPEVDQATGRA